MVTCALFYCSGYLCYFTCGDHVSSPPEEVRRERRRSRELQRKAHRTRRDVGTLQQWGPSRQTAYELDEDRKHSILNGLLRDPPRDDAQERPRRGHTGMRKPSLLTCLHSYSKNPPLRRPLLQIPPRRDIYFFSHRPLAQQHGRDPRAYPAL